MLTGLQFPNYAKKMNLIYLMTLFLKYPVQGLSS